MYPRTEKQLRPDGLIFNHPDVFVDILAIC